ncbi:MAG: hypothetical protein HY306_02365 [Nitrosomonadales bacterium]|nr:hypothetical protein [Nitrosomonadales bacterium]
MNKKYLAISFGLISLLGYATAQASCGSAACSINTNWDEHSASHPGWTADLRYSYSRADTLRSGSNKISVNPADPALVGTGEVENLRTINQITTAVLDYTHDDHWGVMLHIPYVTRDHNHSLAPDTLGDPIGYESFHAAALGDIKVAGRYRWALDESGHSGMGVKFGLKLNTGKKDFVIAQTGTPPGEVTLQPGNGSTDLILGLFWNQSPPDSDWSWFAQSTVQSSISSDAAFHPGNQINLDGGTRYAISHNLSALLQLNAQWSNADSGAAAALTPAGATSSGGKIYSLTPGLSYAVAPDTQLYGLAQLPLYQYVNGEQLTANSSITVGVSHRF